jgi:hypothetical protein
VSRIHWFVAEIDPRNAGYRVRTLPLSKELERQGEEIVLHPLSELPGLADSIRAEARAVIVSKPGDSLSAAAMRHLTAAGVPVVVDLFDNYFSWNPGLVLRQLQWQWLRALRSASLVMCSSPYLEGVLRTLTDKAIVRVSDPVPQPLPGVLEPAALATRWVAPAPIELLWFGIAGNPFFAVGLQDLVNWSGLLRRLRLLLPSSVPMRLTVCTNRTPAVEQALEALRDEALDVRFVEWTEEGCDALLLSSHVVMLPTNTSGFGLAKTHNRCSDALARGCLVLASPQGPYQGLGGAVFEQPGALAATLREASPESVRRLVHEALAALQSRQDLVAEVASLRQHIAAARRPAARSEPSPEPRRVLILARVKSVVPKSARGLGFLLAGFADFGPRLNLDLSLASLAAHEGRVTLLLSAEALELVDALLAAQLEFDVDDRGDRILYRHQGWSLCVDRPGLRVQVLAGFDEDSLRELGQAQELAASASGATLVRCVDILVGVMTRLLWQLGLRHCELAAEQEGGWAPFAAQGDPELDALAARLHRQWQQHEGREWAWPGSAPSLSEG